MTEINDEFFLVKLAWACFELKRGVRLDVRGSNGSLGLIALDMSNEEIHRALFSD